ncbi:matrix metalloproteinase-14-like isoform X2 [Acanthaster planci]|uniref:Matrix metalloproteinase-14-like isoform X2 n=1 Tax=Acanthaster planci TaxID=133434 RepID=A0A8B7ZB04_ACAPL|nr:matrix metalloproteinase-14-like isoform X2 [Acanthaster planci]
MDANVFNPAPQSQWNTQNKRTLAVVDAVWTCLLRVSLGLFILLGPYTQAAPTSTHLPGEDDAAGPEELVTPGQLRTGYNYLTKYGFLPKPDPVAGSLRSQAEFYEGIRAFQTFYGLPVTGTFDTRTAQLMALPRCGLPDIMRDDDEDGRRKRRYVHTGAHWDKQDVTYRITNYSPDLTRSETDEAIASALQLWGDVIPLNFRKLEIGTADIEISFARGLHRDDYPFDGPGGTLAHAFFPGDDLGGDAHFDDDERFTVKAYEGTNLFIVAAHEFGHSLGLGHSSDLSSLMAPFYQGYKPNYVLPYDDHVGAQSLYGARPGSVPSRGGNTGGGAPGPPDRANPTSEPETNPSCRGSYNAIAKIRGELMLFKGKTFWRMLEKGHPLEGYPIDTDRFWDQLPTKVDAAYERIDSKILFFKGASYWEYSGTTRDPSFPRPIRELGLPNDIDAALPWGETGKTYFFKGDQYWRYDEMERQVDMGYPKSVREKWDTAVPTNMDTAFRFVDETGTWYTYFLRNKKYWQFDESRGKVDKGFPRSFDVDWMGCPEPASNLVEDSTSRADVVVEPPRTEKMIGSGADSARGLSYLTHISLLVLCSWMLTG